MPFSSDYVKKCRARAEDYDKVLTQSLNRMLQFGVAKQKQEQADFCLDDVIRADKEFCSNVLDLMHKRKFPKYVITFYEEIYNSVRAVLDKQDYEEVKYLREYLK